MFTQKVTVHFVDGTSKEVVLDQWSISQWAMFSQKQGFRMDMGDPGLIAVAMLRYQAYSQQFRDTNGARPSFDIWDRTVIEVETEEEPETVDPTRQVISGG